ncbi:MAG: tetratricopeptide repeat protein [Candidatus Gracilibacteria bacterium]|jgi:tetratricopeptide (TPR) repeat protein|nr:tetratricopeptide repeat protein [Candidatus Gracilibacteria bacterium]
MKKHFKNLRKAEELKEKEKYPEAIKTLENILTENPKHIAALEELANVFLLTDQDTKAKKVAAFLMELNHKNFTANHVLGFLELNNSNWHEAIEFLQKANEQDANNPEVLRCLGWGLFHKGDKTEGMAILERALSLEPENPMALCDLGICLFQEQKIPEAKEHFKKAMEFEPENERIFELLDLVDRLEQAMGES